MPIEKTENVKEEKKGKVLLIPDSKLVSVITKKETGKTSFGFKIAEGDEVFYATGRLVSRNSDKTGFRVFLPEGEINLYKSIKGADGKYTNETYKASCLADLGYPFAE